MEEKRLKKNRKALLFSLLFLLIAANVGAAMLLIQKCGEKKRLEAQFEAGKDYTQNTAGQEILLLLPETVYACAGATMEIYNAQVTGLGENITTLNILWKCEIGENLERKFSVTATEEMVGSYELVLEIYDNSLELLAEKTCVLRIVTEKQPAREFAAQLENLSQVPKECLEQAAVCVDTAFNGSLDELKPEGRQQLQDIVCAVLSGQEQ